MHVMMKTELLVFFFFFFLTRDHPQSRMPNNISILSLEASMAPVTKKVSNKTGPLLVSICGMNFIHASSILYSWFLPYVQKILLKASRPRRCSGITARELEAHINHWQFSASGFMGNWYNWENAQKTWHGILEWCHIKRENSYIKRRNAYGCRYTKLS